MWKLDGSGKKPVEAFTLIQIKIEQFLLPILHSGNIGGEIWVSAEPESLLRIYYAATALEPALRFYLLVGLLYRFKLLVCKLHKLIRQSFGNNFIGVKIRDEFSVSLLNDAFRVLRGTSEHLVAGKTIVRDLSVRTTIGAI